MCMLARQHFVSELCKNILIQVKMPNRKCLLCSKILHFSEVLEQKKNITVECTEIQKNVHIQKNTHSTVKPFRLQKWKTLCSGVSGEDTRHPTAPFISEAFCVLQQNQRAQCPAIKKNRTVFCCSPMSVADLDWCDPANTSVL